MSGNIIDALNKADVNPMNHHELIKDYIPLMLKEGKLKFAFAKACSANKINPLLFRCCSNTVLNSLTPFTPLCNQCFYPTN